MEKNLNVSHIFICLLVNCAQQKATKPTYLLTSDQYHGFKIHWTKYETDRESFLRDEDFRLPTSQALSRQVA